uniref:Uncharacterized protein n=2 Tax=Ixodes ricinus TaxID=34613 RepID=V5IE02_IXORI
MAYRRAFAHNVQPYSVPQSSPKPISYRRPGDRSGFGFSAEPAPGPQPRDEEDRDGTVSTSQAIAASPTRASPYRAPTPQNSQLRNPHPAVAAAEVVAVPAASCASCGRGCRDVRHACTWTVQVGEVPISYVSHDEWRQQARPERGAPPETVPEPFRGCTLSDRHPREPKAGYSDAERERLCPVCGTLVLHWETHLAGGLHRSRAPPERSQPVPSHMDVVAALQVLQAARPDLIAAPLAGASPEALLAAARTTTQQDVQQQEQPRPSRWGPEPRKVWTAPPTVLSDDALLGPGRYTREPAASNHAPPSYVWR